jgi:hypothetical protein
MTSASNPHHAQRGDRKQEPPMTMLKRRNREPCRSQLCNAAPRIAQQAMHGPPTSTKHKCHRQRRRRIWLPDIRRQRQQTGQKGRSGGHRHHPGFGIGELKQDRLAGMVSGRRISRESNRVHRAHTASTPATANSPIPSPRNAGSSPGAVSSSVASPGAGQPDQQATCPPEYRPSPVPWRADQTARQSRSASDCWVRE